MSEIGGTTATILGLQAERDAALARAEAAERERDYYRSVLEEMHRDAHDALSQTGQDNRRG